jgi:hypothetical protein
VFVAHLWSLIPESAAQAAQRNGAQRRWLFLADPLGDSPPLSLRARSAGAAIQCLWRHFVDRHVAPLLVMRNPVTRKRATDLFLVWQCAVIQIIIRLAGDTAGGTAR